MKILFITSTRLGDAVLTTGALDYLKNTYPKGRVTVACGSLPQSIFEGFWNVERIIALKKKPFHGHWVDLWKQVGFTKWDMVIDFRDTIISRIVLAKKRFLFGSRRGEALHKVEQAAYLLKLSYVPSPKLYFTPAQIDFAKNLIAPSSSSMVLAVGPSANWIGKTWPPENFIKVIDWMTSPDGPMPNARVAVFAAPGEEDQARAVLNSVPKDRQIDGIAKGNPGEAAAALSLCDFYIGNDSGLMHAAAASGIPTFGLFGPSYAHLYAPWGDHTGYLCTPQTYDELIDFDGYDPKTLKHSLMTGLEVQDVIDAIKSFEPLQNSIGSHLLKKTYH